MEKLSSLPIVLVNGEPPQYIYCRLGIDWQVYISITQQHEDKLFETQGLKYVYEQAILQHNELEPWLAKRVHELTWLNQRPSMIDTH